ncbi:hypothetical protein SKAU_G00062010 [Synaphobranchus kaupii]|uniref:Uncharacterized protein n=1 Tax=Synaphobranchus kaupii TaxID=118154 RepID=A0A9Q1G5Z9_SYNKA|nr:hypothetical protein SKAU_G00062010 [Synaphobranchus kaupii]
MEEDVGMGNMDDWKSHVDGQRKIQDVWDSIKYRIVRCLDDAGRVYAIRPLDDSRPERDVHRTELRVIPTALAPGSPSNNHVPIALLYPQQDILPLSNQTSEEEEADDALNLLVRRPVHPCHLRALIPVQGAEQVTNPQVSLPVEEQGLRRSARRTAGQHSNPHNLPQ